MKEDKRIIKGIWVFTGLVYALVIFLHELPQLESAPAWINLAPQFHALLNGTCALTLVASFLAIKRRNVGLHRMLNTTAMALSLVFLLSYVFYHTFAGSTAYEGEYEIFYYVILISHILLAGLSLPFILLAYYRGHIGAIEKHRRMVRYTYPVWLYVSITGVMVYWFLAPYYGS